MKSIVLDFLGAVNVVLLLLGYSYLQRYLWTRTPEFWEVKRKREH